MSFTLKIKPETEELQKLYENHGTFYEGDDGIDLYCPEEVTIKGGETKIINLKIKCEGSAGFQLVLRSSTASKTPLRLANSIGIIDKGYRGNIMAIVDNIKNESFTIKKHQRLFQLIACIYLPIKIELTNTLSNTDRGEGGLGSSSV